MEPTLEPPLEGAREERINRLETSGLERPIGRRDRGTEVLAGRLETGVGRALPGAMHPHDGLEEPGIGQLLRGGVELVVVVLIVFLV
jgi:hypothetical protein